MCQNAVRRLKDLRKENVRLKLLVADQRLDARFQRRSSIRYSGPRRCGAGLPST